MKNLEEKLKEIKKLIIEFRGVYLKNEQAVRDQLINPVLNELGWITSNPRFVRPDITNQDGKIPDYTLLKNNKDTLIVEAKNLGTDVDNNKIIEQLASYCYSLNLSFDFGILTNGEKWLLFNTFEKNPAERIVWIADLKTESIENVSRKISSFSYQNIEKLATLIELSKNLELVWDSFIENTQDVGKIVAEQIKSRLRKDYPKTKIDVEEIEKFVLGKLAELFDSYAGLEVEKESNRQESKKENEFAEVEDFVYKNEPLKKIKVTFPDGLVIYERNVKATFVETIRRIGIEKVRKLNKIEAGVPLISDKVPTYHDSKGNSREYNYYAFSEDCYLMTNTSTEKKFATLNEINSDLKENLKIEHI